MLELPGFIQLLLSNVPSLRVGDESALPDVTCGDAFRDAFLIYRQKQTPFGNTLPNSLARQYTG